MSYNSWGRCHEVCVGVFTVVPLSGCLVLFFDETGHDPSLLGSLLENQGDLFRVLLKSASNVEVDSITDLILRASQLGPSGRSLIDDLPLPVQVCGFATLFPGVSCVLFS